MTDTLLQAPAVPHPVDLWLAPLAEDQPTGPDLEYDPESLELTDSTGKPESQFGPGEPPNWPRIKELSESLLGRTRDLRFAMWWGRARLNMDGYAALPAVLALLHGLLDAFWDHLHPMPEADDPDAQGRLSVVGGFDKLDDLLGDLRSAKLSSDARLAGLRVRDVEVALSKLTPRNGEAAYSQTQISGMLAAAPEAAAELNAETDASLASLKQLQMLMTARFAADKIVDLTTVRSMLTGLKSMLPAISVATTVQEAGGGGATSTAAIASDRPASGVHSVDTRQDAIRAIDLVCAYLERHEPTNPAQFLLRRAERVIDKNFLQLVKELAPDAVKEVSRIMGVDPSTLNDQN